MNLLKEDAVSFVIELETKLPSNVNSIICAPSLFLNCLVKHGKGIIDVGAQNMYYQESGAFTGEISPVMLKDLGVKYCIIGHSERREIFKEDDELISLKVESAIKHSIKPILCIGETLEIRNSNKTNELLKNQLIKDLSKVKDFKDIIIAYEPIWAIGTGVSATVKEAEDTIKYIKQVLKEEFNVNLPVLYGGSVKTNNFEEFIKNKIIDGALIGGASLDPNNFIEFTKIASKYSI